MTKSFVIVYLLNGTKYEGEVYVSADTNKYGFSCYADPYYRFELDVKKIYIDNPVKPVNKIKKEVETDVLFYYV